MNITTSTNIEAKVVTEEIAVLFNNLLFIVLSLYTKHGAGLPGEQPGTSGCSLSESGESRRCQVPTEGLCATQMVICCHCANIDVIWLSLAKICS